MKAGDYIDITGFEYKRLPVIGRTELKVLSFLNGRKWDNGSTGFCTQFTPF